MFYKKTLTKTLTVIGALLLVLGLSVSCFWLGRISTKDKSDKFSVVSDQEIQNLKSELSSVKSKLTQSNNSQKRQLEDIISSIEDKIKFLDSQDKSVVLKLEEAIKKIGEKIEDDKLVDDPKPVPGVKREEKVGYMGIVYDETGRISKFVSFTNFSFFFGALDKGLDVKVIRISDSHPKIKELLNKGKLKKSKEFIIRYGKVDKVSEKRTFMDFDENNKELDIEEV